MASMQEVGGNDTQQLILFISRTIAALTDPLITQQLTSTPPKVRDLEAKARALVAKILAVDVRRYKQALQRAYVRGNEPHHGLFRTNSWPGSYARDLQTLAERIAEHPEYVGELIWRMRGVLINDAAEAYQRAIEATLPDSKTMQNLTKVWNGYVESKFKEAFGSKQWKRIQAQDASDDPRHLKMELDQLSTELEEIGLKPEVAYQILNLIIKKRVQFGVETIQVLLKAETRQHSQQRRTNTAQQLIDTVFGQLPAIVHEMAEKYGHDARWYKGQFERPVAYYPLTTLDNQPVGFAIVRGVNARSGDTPFHADDLIVVSTVLGVNLTGTIHVFKWTKLDFDSSNPPEGLTVHVHSTLEGLAQLYTRAKEFGLV